ncbi:MAG: mandelate racemase/muconate lactonizing enzyme family protein [Tannerella sp.]|jgi:L-alanine-DL-glutamate epimerase-like enolase superfamily enzyme|nr:mandelate racemase/muconate lactonizing enzyme family protein [Tannerella sp.]
MKTTTRRQFLGSAVMGGMAITGLHLNACASGNNKQFSEDELQARYDKLDQVLEQPIFKKELFPDPVIIDTVELMAFNNIYVCRVRSRDGAEGIAACHPFNTAMLVPIFLNTARSFFIGQDARELDLLVQKFYLFNSNFRLNGLAIAVPLSNIEFAILDMMGKIANKSAAQLIGDIHNPDVGIYVATEHRGLALDEHFERIKSEVAEFDVTAVKIRVGYMTGTKDVRYTGVEGKAEKLIPMVREHYGDHWSLYADANGWWKVPDAIRIGKILEENNYAFYEEPVMYYHFEEIKKVADALTIPIANGEQDQHLYNFRWLLANDGIGVVEPDGYYTGGMIRSMRVALMGQAMGKPCVTHMSGGGLGFIYNALLVSAIPNSIPHTEFKSFRTNIPYECPTAEMKIVNGKMKAPTGPGLGAIIDPDFLSKFEPVRR